MDSIFAFIVGLLTAALSLMGFVQAHPELPQASRDSAIEVAQQAVLQANSVLASNNPKNQDTFSVSPASGQAPLTVHFTVPRRFDCAYLSCNPAHAPSYTIDYGDGTNSIVGRAFRNKPDTEHVYEAAGTYTATLSDTTDGKGSGGSYPVVGKVTIKVTGSAQSNVSVPGMIQYIDSDYGFSFWHPSNWKVSKSLDMNASYLGGSRVAKISISDGKHSITISEVFSNRAVTVPYNGMGEGRLLNHACLIKNPSLAK